MGKKKKKAPPLTGNEKKGVSFDPVAKELATTESITARWMKIGQGCFFGGVELLKSAHYV